MIIIHMGERTLGRFKLGICNMCIKNIHFQNVLHLILSFIFGDWALYFDFFEINVV
jgi:hypothetical protein